ncbi:hypothetical protein MRB53_001357 [Persea americana]|uniref:Uncharacterized protein n=1 Tax=Persea americana TaxID=3435 RepID=A0ACC2MRL6_PERAE|nr:hypothetical protein MRB53_001357 [Persea americana]
MRILNWMQNKLNGGKGSKRPTMDSQCHPKQEASKEEFSDWPHAFLAIGTFGNHQPDRDLDTHDSSENSHSSQRFLDVMEEEVGEFQKELRKLLSLKPIANGNESREDSNLPLDRFLNCPSSLEVDRTNREKPCSDTDDEHEDDDTRNTSVILSKAKGICMDKNNGIRQRSISFLLKKMFICHGGFAPTQSLRDQIPDSRREKLLREILHKNILSRRSASPAPRRYLANKHTSKTCANDQGTKKADDGSKWVKTDSDFIVLEM